MANPHIPDVVRAQGAMSPTHVPFLHDIVQLSVEPSQPTSTSAPSRLVQVCAGSFRSGHPIAETCCRDWCTCMGRSMTSLRVESLLFHSASINQIVLTFKLQQKVPSFSVSSYHNSDFDMIALWCVDVSLFWFRGFSTTDGRSFPSLFIFDNGIHLTVTRRGHSRCASRIIPIQLAEIRQAEVDTLTGICSDDPRRHCWAASGLLGDDTGQNPSCTLHFHWGRTLTLCLLGPGNCKT